MDDGVFGLTKVWQVHLELTPQAHDALQPGRGGDDVHKGGGFGLEFPWVRADATIDGEALPGVGLRYKGNASYGALSQGLRRNFRIDIDRHAKGRQFHGLTSLSLGAGGLDPTRGRESLAFDRFRAMGVPAPRTAYAEVTMTVPGRWTKEFVGLYTVVEPVDKRFQTDRFGGSDGALLKPEGLADIEYRGDDWARYENPWRPERRLTDAQQRRLIAFTKLVHTGSDADYARQIGDFLDVEGFLRFVAGNALLVTLDNIFTNGHNAYVAQRADGKFVFVPWDMDVALAAVPFVGTPEQRVELSLMHPHPRPFRLIDRTLAIPAYRARYKKLLEGFAAKEFSRATLLALVERIEAVTTPRLARERAAAAARREPTGVPGYGTVAGRGPFGRAPGLRDFVEKRCASVAGQLAGTRVGYVPAGGFGGPNDGPIANFPGPFQALRSPVLDELKPTPAQRKALVARRDAVNAAFRDAMPKLQSLPPEQQGPRMQALQQEWGAPLDAFLNATLTADQRRRLREIDLQREGPFALLRPDVGAQIGLRDEQRPKLMEVALSFQKAVEPLMRRIQSGGDPTELGPKAQALRREHGQRLETLLTDAQRAKWKALLGKPFPWEE